MPRLLDGLKRSDKIIKIWLTTNGTLMPDETLLPLMRDPRVCVTISDYDALSSRKAELIDMFERLGIAYNVAECASGGWIDFGDMHERGRSWDETCKIYKTCRACSSCNPMIGDKLFPCARVARMDDLGLRKAESCEYAALEADPERTRRNVEKLLAADGIPCCDFCDSWSGARIPAALQ
ncbi:MAG: hypothetical protein LBR38_01910 [Synergistaceae bacterium]|jgi:hypothetical protein|nr:hypothetical protein [Synergistaceae bacterium]